jgi:glycosyltransferase involved in cell wall biosynthesis
MHTLLIADGRSAITRGWLRMLSAIEGRISLVSTFPCDAPEGAELLGVLPAGFAALAGGQVRITGQPAADGGANWKRTLLNTSRPLLRALRAYLAPLTLGKYQRRLAEICALAQPDLAHALRIPFEGMLAAVLPASIPLIVSIWGNDLTLHAPSSVLMAANTRRTLKRADGLLADATRDMRLAAEWGLPDSSPRLVLPGNGGLDFDLIQTALGEMRNQTPFDLPNGRPFVVNPRGFRPGSVHQDTFFESIPLVLKTVPDAFFVCTAMRGQPQAQGWVKKLGLENHVLLLPYLPQDDLWRLFSRSQVYLSLSSHDGTPNTFLEAAACGCFPVVGDIESLREWISDGENGLLVNPRDAQAAAEAVIRAIGDSQLREHARERNRALLAERADIRKVRQQYSAFISQIM